MERFALLHNFIVLNLIKVDLWQLKREKELSGPFVIESIHDGYAMHNFSPPKKKNWFALYLIVLRRKMNISLNTAYLSSFCIKGVNFIGQKRE